MVGPQIGVTVTLLGPFTLCSVRSEDTATLRDRRDGKLWFFRGLEVMARAALDGFFFLFFFCFMAVTR